NQLQTALAGLTPEARASALQIMYGSYAIKSATALYEAGASGVAEWTDAVNDSGYAAETAAARLDNLAGDWEAFTGAMDTALIALGSAADGALRGLVQGMTGMVDMFNGLPDGAQTAVFWIGAITAAVALAGGAFLLAVPKIAAFKVALTTLGMA